MKITQITYARGATVNRGNFNNERVDIGVTVEVTDADPEGDYERVREWVCKRVKAEIA